MDPQPLGVAFTRLPHVVRAASLTDDQLTAAPLDAAQVVAGGPQVHELGLYRSADLMVGIWQHSPGVSTDVETDEIFVVVSGEATIEVLHGPTMTVGPGDVVLLPAGAQTRWTVHTTLRKVYVARP